MGEKFTPISQVTPTYDPNKIVKLHNPLGKVFEHDFDGNPYKIPKGLSDWTEPLAHFFSDHIAATELSAGMREAELDERAKGLEMNKDDIVLLSKGLKPADVKARALELVLDPKDGPQAKQIKKIEEEAKGKTKAKTEAA